MPTRLATYGALQDEASICALLFCHENQDRNTATGSSGSSGSFGSSGSQSSSHGEHMLFAQANKNGDIVIYGKNGVEIRLEDPTRRTKFLLFASYGR